MLKISKLADYATVIMHWLSSRQEGCFSASVIAERTGIALPTVSKVLKRLNDVHLVTSVRGVQGGYQLSRPAEQMSLAEIISAVDGKPALTECSDKTRQCRYDRHCEIRGNWQYINQVIYDVLNRLTLRDMMSSLSKEAIPMHFHPSKIKEDEHVRSR